MDKLKNRIINCKRCRLSENSKRPLPGEGAISSKIMLITLSPSKHDDERQKVLAGKDGRILDKLFKSIGINRNFFYITNLLKCVLLIKNPKEEQVLKCMPFLEEEIKIIRPSVLVPIGEYVWKYIFRKYGIKLTYKSKEEIIGNLVMVKNIKILPLRSLDLTSGNKELLAEYYKLKVLLKECKWFSVCPMKRFYEQGKLDKKWIEKYCKGDWSSCVRYRMEERGEYHPDSMLPDGTIRK